MDYFIPSMMIVATSWVTFWIQADNSAPRVMLGTTTMLAFITLASNQAKTLPKVSYIKASEIWFLACTGFIFGSLVEFAFVNTIWRRKKNVPLKKVNSHYIFKGTLTPRLARKELQKESFTNGIIKAHSMSSIAQTPQTPNQAFNNYLTVQSYPSQLTLPIVTTEQSNDNLEVTIDQVNASNTDTLSSNGGESHKQHTWTTMTPQEISIWIDKKSRIAFPVAFIVFNAIYWIFVYAF